MIIPVKHELLRSEDRRFRVLWSHPRDLRVFVLEVSREGGWPKTWLVEDVLDELAARVLTVEEFQDTRRYDLDQDLDPKHIAVRDRAWNIIRDLVEDEPAAYDRAHRCAFIHAAMAKHGASRSGIENHLQRFWRNGMTKNALLPRFANCGAPGRVRAETEVRRGRPKREGYPEGLNTSAEHRHLFGLAIKHHYAKNRKLTLMDAHKDCIRLFFTEKSQDASGKIVHTPKPEFVDVGFPSFGQFKYWTQRDGHMNGVAQKRMTTRVYEAKNRALLGSATSQSWGPGARFQIDATILDLHLVSRRDRRQRIGRPVVYVVIDEFSRLIVGVYVGLEGPSYVAAMMALANAVAPKKAFCESLGITIEEDEWPAHHLPGIILGDRGELEGTGITNILETFGVLVENAPPYRGDWKGVVERSFNTLHSGFKAYVPGYVEPDFAERGARDYRADAVFTLDDVTKMIVDHILFYNNHHVISRYDRESGMTEDGVLSILADLWRWGIANMGGKPKTSSPERVRFALMPTAMASVTEHGIKFNSCLYTCDEAISKKWFESARKRRTKIKISYDDRDVDLIYVHTPKASQPFQVGRILLRSREFEGLTHWEAGCLARKTAVLHAQHAMTEQIERANYVSRTEASAAEASARPSGSGPSPSLRQQTKGIRANRAHEKAERRVEEKTDFRPVTPVEQPAGEVVSFPTGISPASNTYDRPNVSAFKRKLSKTDE